MFKEGDKVRFIGKNAGNYSIEDIKKDYRIDITKEPCYGTISDVRTFDDTVVCNVCDGFNMVPIGRYAFRQKDLIQFNAVDYDALNEIEE